MNVKTIIGSALVVTLIACNGAADDADEPGTESGEMSVTAAVETDTTAPACTPSLSLSGSAGSRSCGPTVPFFVSCTFVSGACTCPAPYYPLWNAYCFRGK